MPKSKEFLSSSDSECSGADEPKPKKKKPEPKPAKESSKDKKGKSQRGAGGEYMFELSRMKYATVSKFKGKVMVGIREYYEKDNELRPGKKGISLNLEQWETLKNCIDDVDEACQEL